MVISIIQDSESGREYPIYCRKKYESNGKEQILLDVNKLAEGHDYVLALELKVSPDDRYMIYMVDYSGRNLFVVSILDLQTGQLLPTGLKPQEVMTDEWF